MPEWRLNLDREDFLANYWQQKPLLIRSAITPFEPPLSSDELAGLALEEEIESRIIECREQNWCLSHGPFTAADFQRDHPWTLLVQAVDHYIPEVAQLRKLVDFIPQWRVDDVMISYAADGASVGPHYDNYDVFLLQGLGKRNWKLGQRCDGNSPLLAHGELRILDSFQCEEEYSLSSGDILYVPPGVAHWGIAEGECLTYSIGFRAPRINDLLSRSVDALLEHGDSERFYRDPALSSATRPGEITAEAISSARHQLLAALGGHMDDAWFGELVTEPKYELNVDAHEESRTLAGLDEPTAGLELLPWAKLAWQENDAGVVVFANGESHRHSAAVLPMMMTLCKQWRLQGAALADALNCTECAILLEQLLESGCLESE